jgi:glycosyltransferase involved in cell wall biosynthesis
MKLWIDGQCLQTGSRDRGIGRYLYELIRAISINNSDVHLLLSFNAALPNELIAARKLVQPWVKPNNVLIWQGAAEGGEAVIGYTQGRALSENALAHHVECIAPDLALCGSPFEGAHDPAVPYMKLADSNIASAAIFYDAIPKRFSSKYLTSRTLADYYQRRLDAQKNFDLLLAISEFSKSEAIELIGHKLVVNINAGVSPALLNLLATRGRRKSTAVPKISYVLYVGALDWRKNVLCLVQAFSFLSVHYQSNLALVIAGAYQEFEVAELRKRWNNLGLAVDNLVTLGKVSDETLIELYREAALTVQPSLMEGFGLTALEAMLAGSVVIASNSGALPEVIGNPKALFDPSRPEELAALITQVLEDADFRQSLKANAHNQREKYSWDFSAEKAVSAMSATILSASTDRDLGPTDVTALEVLRAKALKRLSRRQLTLPFAAEVFAAAEPPPDTSISTLFVDVTTTTKFGLHTGIQRVVRKISQAFIEDVHTNERVQLMYCESGSHALPVIVDGNWAYSQDQSSEKLRFGAADLVLMLDSCWDYAEAHDVVLTKAKVHGAQTFYVLYDLLPIQCAGFCNTGVSSSFVTGFYSQLRFSDGFICISKSVANELLDLLSSIEYPREVRIGYWHLGADVLATKSQRSKSGTTQIKHAFLMVGTIEPRKGHQVVLDAFEVLWSRGFDAELWIVGRAGWATENVMQRLKCCSEYGRKLKWVDGPEDDELVELYQRCTVLIAASYAEGFGLPLVEAAFYRKPIIASDIPVFREIGNGSPGVMFFNVGSSTDLIRVVETATQDYEALIASTKSSNNVISWDESAKELRSVLAGRSWTHTYVPSAGVVPNQPFNRFAMNSVVPLANRNYSLELIGAPNSSTDGKYLEFLFRVTNLSGVTWSSFGLPDGSLAVNLGYHTFDELGRCVSDNNPRAHFVFALPKEAWQITKVSIPTSLLVNVTTVDFAVVQEGIAWWPSKLKFNLVDR